MTAAGMLELAERDDEAFCAAVWRALKGDHNDLRKQALILEAHRAHRAHRAAGQAELREALEFYADESAWNEPPVQTVNHEIFGKAYQNQASKVRLDRGRKARSALRTSAVSEGEGK